MNTNTLNKRLWRILSAMLTIAMILTSVSIPAFAADKHDVSALDVSKLDEFSAEASGTEFKISNAKTLKEFAEAVKKDNGNGTYSMSGKTFYLANDIDLKEEAFTPIANVSYPGDGFAGTFDGNYNKITGLNISSGVSGIGLFGTVNGATIKNLEVVGNVSGSSTFVGGIIGKTQGSVTVENCSFSGSGTGTKSNSSCGVGGIVGRVNGGTPTIKGCANFATINAQNGCPGGILGYGGDNEIIISNCYNSGSINGRYYPSGILASNTGKNNAGRTIITNCYNIGEIKNTNGGANNAGISANFKGTATNCYRTQPKTDSYASNQNGTSTLITTPDALLDALGSAFIKDSDKINNGYPILSWQKSDAPVQPKKPGISISGVSNIHMTNDGSLPTKTLSVNCENMDEGTPVVVWEVTNGGDIVSAKQDNNNYIITPQKGGKVSVKVTVTYNGTDYEKTAEFYVMPYITGVQIYGDISVGETVEAKVFTFGGGEYDYANLPEIKYQWYTAKSYSDESTYSEIPGATGKKYTIDNSYAGKYLIVEAKSEGNKINYLRPTNDLIASADKKITEQDAKALADVIDTSDVRAEKTFKLPTVGNSGETTITWTSTNDNIINAENGKVTLPKTEDTDVTLTAKVSYNREVTYKTFVIKVCSVKTVTDERNNKLLPVTKTLEALGDFYKLMPKYGTDENIVNMFKADLTKKAGEIKQDISGFEVKLSKVAEQSGNGGSSIDNNGKILYYYVDPNKYPTQHLGTHKASFIITYNGETVNYDDVSVTVDWDEKRVQDAMNEQIVSKINVPQETSENIELPKIIDEKTWAIVSWSSNNPDYLTISDDNKTSADTALAPYSGVVKRGTQDEQVTLTATCKFNFSDKEEPIVVRKTYNVTVKAIDAAEAGKIQKELDDKLNAGFKKAGLCDAVTKKALTENEDGKVEVLNDIQFPTTRDFGIDGKETPVIITTDNENVVIPPDVNNAARVEIIRPAVGKESAKATVTLAITQKDTNISASKTFNLSVPALTKNEIDAEKALMTKVKESYFDGIKDSNTDEDDIDSDLKPFTEVYEKDGKLVWVRDSKNMTGHGIVPTELDGWYELQAWRLFRSSNPAAITHENLLVTKQKNAKTVTVDSALSSETLGKYGKLYKSDKKNYAAYADLADLYYQPVSVNLIVRGTSTKRGFKPVAVPNEKINVSFSLMDNEKTLIETTKYENLDEITTAFDVFKKAMQDSRYEYELKYGTYVPSITMPDGTKLGELDRGENSGWMYRVNGKIPDVSMGAYGLKDGDSIVVFYTDDYTKEDGMKDYGGSSSSGTTGVKKDNKKNNTNKNSETVKTDNTQTISSETFTDVKADDWFCDAVKFVYENKIMKGVSDDSFEPDEKLSRAMIVTILYRMENEPSASFNKFGDVNADEWYGAAVAWASQNGIVNGVSENDFAPNDDLTREQMAAIIYRYIKFKGKDVSVGENTNILSYDDAEYISDYAIDAICYAVGSGLMKGDSESTLNPNGTATRAETAMIIMRLFNIMK